MFFQQLVEMFVVHVSSQILWQSISHLRRTGSRETSVAETDVYAWNGTDHLRRRLKLWAASVSNKLDVGSQGPDLLNILTAILRLSYDNAKVTIDL